MNNEVPLIYNFSKNFNLYYNSSVYNSSAYSEMSEGFINKYLVKSNVISQCINCIASILSLDTLRVSFYSSNASNSEYDCVVKLNNFLDSFIENTAVKEQYNYATINSLIFGVGILKLTPNGIISVSPDNIYVLSDELINFDFSFVSEKNSITKRTFLKSYPGILELSESKKDTVEYIKNLKSDANVNIIEEYDTVEETLKITVDNKELCCQSLGKQLPYIFLFYSNVNTFDFRLHGLVEELLPYQDQIDNLINRIRDAITIVSTPIAVIDGNNNIQQKALENLNSYNNKSNIQILKTTDGKTPEFGLKHNSLDVMIQYLEYLIQSAYTQVGLNKTMIDGSVPSKALRTQGALDQAYDKMNSKFNVTSSKYLFNIKKFFMNFVSVMSNKNIISKTFKKRYAINEIDFDILYKGIYYTQHIVVNQTSDTETDISGRINIMTTLVQSGIPISDLMPLLITKDLEKTYSHITSSYQRVNKFIDLYLEGIEDIKGISSDMNLNFLRSQVVSKRNEFYVLGKFELYDKLSPLSVYLDSNVFNVNNNVNEVVEGQQQLTEDANNDN